MNKEIIPKEKIKGQRFGQLIYNALRIDAKEEKNQKELVADRLFNIDNKELQERISKLFKTYE